jgi:hypothetical protein
MNCFTHNAFLSKLKQTQTTQNKSNTQHNTHTHTKQQHQLENRDFTKIKQRIFAHTQNTVSRFHDGIKILMHFFLVVFGVAFYHFIKGDIFYIFFLCSVLC